MLTACFSNATDTLDISKDVIMANKRSVVEWTDEQYAELLAASRREGYPSVPAYVKVKALEASRERD